MRQFHVFCVKTDLYSALARSFHTTSRNFIHHSSIKYYFSSSITISVTSRGSDKPVCHGGAKLYVCYGYPRPVAIIITFCYGLLRSYAVSCVLTKAQRFFSFCQGQLNLNGLLVTRQIDNTSPVGMGGGGTKRRHHAI